MNDFCNINDFIQTNNQAAANN
jgi:hypothetical protein